MDSQFFNYHLLQFGAYEIKTESYEKKLERTIKDKKINEVSFFEIEDIFFEKRIKLFFSNPPSLLLPSKINLVIVN